MQSFNVIAARNLGQHADVLGNSSQTLGQAGISVNANALNGNVFVKDHQFAYVDRGVHLNVGMVYNSQSEQPWKINLGKKIIGTKDVNAPGSSITLIEEDGGKTVFNYDEGRQCYVEHGARDGARTLTFDGEHWLGWDPATGARDSYDQSLRLDKTLYADGASIEYNRDADGKITALRTTSGQSLEIEYEGRNVKLWCNKDGERKLWVTYQFDDKNNLIKSVIPLSESQSYVTNYEHESRTGLLRSIEQSDNTALQFDYVLDGSVVKVHSITDGEGRRVGFNHQPGQVELINPCGKKTTYRRDEQGRLSEKTDGVHDQSFQYDQSDRLEKITYADGTHDLYSYDELSFCQHHNDRNDDVTQFKHNKTTGALLSVRKAKSVTAFYYNKKRQLRYEVTPVGGVIEYQYDQLGNRISKKEYLEAGVVTGDKLLEWIKTVDKTKVAITEWTYHANGQIAKEVQYATIDEHGVGVYDEYAAEKTYEWDEHGNCLKTGRRLDELTIATTKNEYDGLSRLKEHCDALGRVTVHGYRGSSHSILSVATGHETIIRRDKSGQIVKQIERADSITRQITHLLDVAGRCYAALADDGSKTYFVYDDQGRKIFKIDAEKRVTAYRYNLDDQVTHEFKYATPINEVDESSLFRGMWMPVVAGECSVTRKMYDAENRLRYSIDGENYLTEYRYDVLGNVTDKISYATVSTGEPPVAPSEKDRQTRYFYQKDGTRLAKQLPTGQVIHYTRNKRGDLLEKRRYVTSQIINGEFDVSKLIASDKDGVVIYKRDARGQCVAMIDAENVLTENQHDAGGRLIATKKETQQAEYEHDELDRVIGERHSNGLEIERDYHPNDELRYELKRDGLDDSSEQALYLQYNGFGEQTKAVTDKASVLSLMSNDINVSAHSRQVFAALLEEAVGERKDKLSGLAVWNALYLYLITDKHLNKSNAALVLDEMLLQSHYFSDKAETSENVNELIRFARLYCLAMQECIVSGTWRTYFGGKLHYEFSKKSILPSELNLIPTGLYEAMLILKSVSDVDKTGDVKELAILKKKLSEVREILDASRGKKSFWRHNETHRFYEKAVKTLQAIPGDKVETKIKVDEEKIYSQDGLVVAKVDILGNVTHYFYDALRRPIYIINADCSIIANQYDVYSNHVTEMRYFDAFLSEALKGKLIGGRVTAELQAEVDKLKSDKDTVVTDKYDKRQLAVEHIDGEKYSTINELNAFGELETQKTTIDKKTSAQRVDKYERDKAGRATKVTRDVGGLAIVESTEYHDDKGEEIHTDGNGNQEKRYYDRLHRLVKLIDAHGEVSTIEWDGLSRIKSEINQLMQQTRYEFSDADRTVKCITPTGTTITKRNAFGKITHTTRLVDNAPIDVIKQYDDHGRIRSIQDAKGETIFLYDARGLVEFEVSPSKVTTKYVRDEMGRIREKIEDLGGINRRVLYRRDSQGRITEECNGEGVWTKYDYNKRGEQIKSIIDPDGLALVTQKQFDGLGKLQHKTQGDLSNEDQYAQSFKNDRLGRGLSETIDPNGLNIVSSNTFDAVGNVTSITDANGATTWLYHDALSRERFHISPDGEVLEKQYDALGRCVMERNYSQPFKVTNGAAYKLADLVDMISSRAAEQDCLVHYVYDANPHPRFKVRVLREQGKPLQGIVEECVYDSAEREVKTIRYASMINLSDGQPIEQQLHAQLDKLRSHPGNRHQRHWYDQSSQERFVVDQSGYVSETRYHLNGKPTQVVHYADAIKTEDLPSDMTLSGLESLVSSKKMTGRVTSYAYDSLGRKIFKVSPTGWVKKYEYDKNDNRLSVCRFKERIDVPVSYDALLDVLHALKPDGNKDSITTIKRDAAGRIEKVTDPLNNKDIYQRDALGGVIKHTDRNDHEWINEFDRARRLIREISPATTIAVVKKADNGKLIHEEIKTCVTRKTGYDAVGNATSIQEAEGLEDLTKNQAKSRMIKFGYHHTRRVSNTLVPHVLVAKEGNDALKAEYTDVGTTTLFNCLGKKAAYCNEKGVWSFYFYDSAGRLKYEIIDQQRLIKYQRNAFDQVEEEYHYAQVINIDIDKAVEAVTNGRMIDEIAAVTTSEDDRLFTHEYDGRGQLKSTKRNKVFFYSEGEKGYAQPEAEYSVNAFGEVVKERRLIRPGVWAEKYTWHDAAGRIIYQIDELNHVTYYERDAVGKETKRVEYADKLEGVVFDELTAEQLDAKINKDKNRDRTYIYEYDQRGDKIAERLLNVTTQKIDLATDDSPVMSDLPPTTLEKQFKYSPTQKPIEITHEDGAKEKKYYDERDLLVAETGITRTSKDEKSDDISITPLSRYVRDAFGEAVVTQTSDKTADVSVKDAVPTFSDPGHVYSDLKLNDERGLTVVHQDANGAQIAFTHTATKKIATQEQEVSIWKKEAAPEEFSQVKRVDAILHSYNQADQPVRTSILSGNKIEQDTYARYNNFGDFLGEGSTPDKLESYQKLDATGLPWFSNTEGGAYTMQLHDLLGHETMRIQSDEIDLSKKALADVDALLAADHAVILLEETGRDALGHAVTKRAPIWYRDAATNQHPTRQYERDRWGNIVKEWDSLRALTERGYDHRNLQTFEAKPKVKVVNDDNTTSEKIPITQYGHNKRGYQVGVTDPKGNTQAVALDEANNVIKQYAEDGVVSEQREYDALSRPVRIYDAKQSKTTNKFDALGNTLSTQLPSGRTYSYGYNEKSDRTLVQDPSGMTVRFVPDARGNCKERYTHLGQCTRTVYDRNRQQMHVEFPAPENVMDPSFLPLEWERDFFGNPLTHKNIRAREHAYQYTFRNKLKLHYAQGGYQREHIQFYPGEYAGARITYTLKSLNDSSPVDVSYEYKFGLLSENTNRDINKRAVYSHDSELRRSSIEIFQTYNGAKIRAITTEHDAHGRESKTTDTHLVINGVMAKAEVTLGYDAADNIRHRELALHAPRYSNHCSDSLQTQSFWNSFDRASRTLIANGELKDGVVQITPKQGVEYGYKDAERVSEQRHDASGLATTDIVYHADGMLSLTHSNRGMDVAWGRHKSGAIEETKEVYSPTDWSRRTQEFNDNGLVFKDRHYDPKLAAHMAGEGYLYKQTDFALASQGMPVAYTTTIHVNHNPTVQRFKLNYSGEDTIKLYDVIRANNDYKTHAKFLFDDSGMVQLKRRSDDEPVESVDRDIVYYDTTVEGWVLSKQYFQRMKLEAAESPLRPYKANHFIHNTSGRVHGSYLTFFSGDESHKDADFHAHPQGRHEIIPRTSWVTPYIDSRPIGNYQKPDANAKLNPQADDFVKFTPPSVPQVYFVTAGDTLESISEKMFGDSCYADRIATLNGLVANFKLMPGYSLVMPEIVPNRNKAYASRPYHEFVALLQGKLIPHVQIQPKHKKDNAHMIGTIAKIVAIGIMIAIAPGLAGFALQAALAGGLISSSIATSATVAAIATGVTAAIGDAAIQGLAIGMGMQSSFSATEMLEVGVTAGAFSGAGAHLSGEGAALAAKQAMYVGSVQVATQLTEMATGMRSHFDAKQVALQIASALAASQIQQRMSGVSSDPHVQTAATTAATTVSDTLLGHAVTHAPIDVQNMAARAIGGTISQEAGGRLAGKLKDRNEANAAAANAHSEARATPGAHAHTHASIRPASSTTQSPRPMTAHEKQTMAEASEVAHMGLDEPGLSLPNRKDAAYQLSEMNRARLRHGETLVGYGKGLARRVISDQVHSTVVGSAYEEARQLVNDGQMLLSGDSSQRNAAAIDLGIFAASMAAPGVLGATGRAAAPYARVAGGYVAKTAAPYVRSVGSYVAKTVSSSRAAFFGRVEETRAIGLTTRLNRAQIKEYLSNAHNISREQLIQDLESIGFKLKDENPTGLFKVFEDKFGNVRVKIHPPDNRTDYSHIHIYDNKGRSLTSNLKRDSYKSPDVHIRIEPIQEELEWRIKK